MSLDSCKLATLPLILLYDELIALLECSTLQPEIIEWVGTHIGEFERLFLPDLEGGQLPLKYSSNDVEVSGELWMNLDGELSPICLNIPPLVSFSIQKCSNSLQILPPQFSLLSLIERLTNQGSLGGIDALLGWLLHLPSVKLNAFSTQIADRIDSVTPTTREEIAAKLFKCLRNLMNFKKFIWTLEEAKADIVGLWALKFLIDQVIPFMSRKHSPPSAWN